MPIVASWVHPPIILPLANFKRNGYRLGFRNSSESNPFGTKLTWAPASTNTSAMTSFLSHRTRTLEVQLPFVAMWSVNNCHGMQL